MDTRKDESKFTLVPTNGIFSEKQLLSRYKEYSSIYGGLLKAAIHLEDDSDVVAMIRELENAQTFKEMFNIIKPYDLEKKNFVYKTLAKPCTNILGFFSSTANYSYYLFKLRDDIIRFGLDHNCKISFQK